jgi:tetratricopeptide (TPR) repeat protein
VSSEQITRKCFVLLLLAGMAMAFSPQERLSAPAGIGLGSDSAASSSWQTPSNNSNARAARPGDPGKVFQLGEGALTHGQLDEAERDFRQVLQLDPQSGAAYANLGVVYMRRKQWTKALDALQKAAHLLPQVAGIKLNMGLAYYRQNEFLKAIPPFESVLRDQDALQPRYLLGLCYFFVERYADAAATLEPLWAQESSQLPYLYVLSNAAHRAGRKELDERATTQLIKLGDGSPAYRLFVGKYHLNLEHYDAALAEFQAAATADPKLPFVHFNLGLTYLKQQDYEHARDEFLKDAAIEPDLALDYDELGDVDALLQNDKDAEMNYREALRRDSRLANSYFGLAKIYQRQEKYAAALTEIDAALKLDPERTDLHYVHGQVLLHLGRKEEAKKELDAAVRIDNKHRAAREKQMDAGTVPSPELLQDPQ